MKKTLLVSMAFGALLTVTAPSLAEDKMGTVTAMSSSEITLKEDSGQTSRIALPPNTTLTKGISVNDHVMVMMKEGKPYMIHRAPAGGMMMHDGHDTMSMGSSPGHSDYQEEED